MSRSIIGGMLTRTIFHPRLAAKAHQDEALRRVANHPIAYAWLMDMGTGKSKVVLDEWTCLVNKSLARDLLIIAPAGSYRNWYKDREGEPSEATKQLDPQLRQNTLIMGWQSGMGIKAKRQLNAFLEATDRTRIFVVNVEALSTVKAAQEACAKFLSNHQAMMVVDESTKIKLYSTKRTKAVINLGHQAKYRRILSGMVAPRDPLDLYTQFEFLDPSILGYSSFWAFRANHAITKKMFMRGRSIQVVVGFRGLDRLQTRLNQFSYRVLKSDCLDLDPKIYTMREVPLHEEQLRIYRELKQFATAALDGSSHVTATSVMVQIGRLHQVLCGFTKDEQGNYHQVPELRTAELIEILEEHPGKVIIWVSYQESIHRVANAIRKWQKTLAEEHGWNYDDGMVATYWGGNVSSRGDEEYRFKTDPACRWLVATPQAGGVGNNWTVADLVIYYSNTYDLEMRAQSEDRVHRQGQTRSVTYIDLVARDTVDEKIIQALRRKIDLYTTITGENYREWLI